VLKTRNTLGAIRQSGANQLNIHVELGEAVTPLIWKIKSLGCKVGLAINPATPISLVRSYLDHLDALLIMTVNPGFGGQSFIHETSPKFNSITSGAERKVWISISVLTGGLI
jgi:ribulose-phosphate 3-epimerase